MKRRTSRFRIPIEKKTKAKTKWTVGFCQPSRVPGPIFFFNVCETEREVMKQAHQRERKREREKYFSREADDGLDVGSPQRFVGRGRFGDGLHWLCRERGTKKKNKQTKNQREPTEKNKKKEEKSAVLPSSLPICRRWAEGIRSKASKVRALNQSSFVMDSYFNLWIDSSGLDNWYNLASFGIIWYHLVKLSQTKLQLH